MSAIFSFAIGSGSKNSAGQWLDIFYPAPQLGLSDNALQALKDVINYSGGNQAIELSQTKAQTLASALDEGQEYHLAKTVEQLAYSTQNLVVTILASDSKPCSVPEVYLKLHLLSHRLVQPNQIKLAGLLNLLPQVVWTSHGAIDIHELAQRQLQARLNGQIINVLSVDRLPQMANYFVPDDVSIADSARVYLGAYLGEGTIIMQDGFVDFNAGTEGFSTIKGVISTGFFIGHGTHLASGSATLSARINETNQQHRLGNECFIGAHTGIGISLGDHCRVEAGIYLAEDTLVHINDASIHAEKLCFAAQLQGKSHLDFYLNANSNKIEVRKRNV